MAWTLEDEIAWTERNPFRMHLGVAIERVSTDGSGDCEIALEINDNLVQAYGMVHGGIYCTLIDTVLGTAVATSFVLASLPGRHPEYLVRALRRLLPIRKPEQLHPEDRPVDVQHAQAVVLGMIVVWGGLAVFGVVALMRGVIGWTSIGTIVVEAVLALLFVPHLRSRPRDDV